MEQDIRTIIATYELPPHLEDRILKIALRQQAESGFRSFNDAYARVSDLVDKHQQGWHEKTFVSLDQKPDDDRSLHEFLGAEDPSLTQILQGQPDTTQTLTVEQALKIQEDNDNTTTKRMKDLFKGYFEVHLGLTAEETINSAEVIEQRMREVFAHYLKDGKMTLPPRPIKRIRFEEGVEIEFARRANGELSDPLGFFHKNIDFYGSMNRSELQHVDGTLYEALRKAGRLPEAIPEKKLTRKRRYGYRGFDSPLAYFHAHPELHVLARSELDQKDPSLYKYLCKWQQIKQAIPRVYYNKKNRSKLYRGFPDPLAYFRAKEHDFQDLSRTQLKERDCGLYFALLAKNQLEDAIPASYRGFPTPLLYFQAHQDKYNGMSRTQLKKTDSGLYQALAAEGDLNKAIKKRREVQIKRPTKYTSRGYESPLAYFCAHHNTFKGLSGRQLQQCDSGVYQALLRSGDLEKALNINLIESNEATI